MTTKYVIHISAGIDAYGPKQGWDTVWDTFNEAAAAAQRAAAVDGWTARVVEIEVEETSSEQRARRTREYAQFGRVID